MRVTGHHEQSIAAAGRPRPAAREVASGESAAAAESAGGSRALIPLSPVRPTERIQSVVRQRANFLAQLIATEQAMPQTRERRRIEPNIASAIYTAAGRPTVAIAPHFLLHAA
jgi:hypothetical protein